MPDALDTDKLRDERDAAVQRAARLELAEIAWRKVLEECKRHLSIADTYESANWNGNIIGVGVEVHNALRHLREERDEAAARAERLEAVLREIAQFGCEYQWPDEKGCEEQPGHDREDWCDRCIARAALPAADRRAETPREQSIDSECVECDGPRTFDFDRWVRVGQGEAARYKCRDCGETMNVGPVYVPSVAACTGVKDRRAENDKHE